MMMMIVFIRTGDRAARENEITISAPSSLWSARARLGPTKTSADEPTTTTSRGCNYCNDQAEFKQEPPLQATTRVVSAAATRSVFARRSPRTEQEQQRSRVVLELKSSGARIQLPAPLGARRLGLLSLAEPISRDKQAIFVPTKPNGANSSTTSPRDDDDCDDIHDIRGRTRHIHLQAHG